MVSWQNPNHFDNQAQIYANLWKQSSICMNVLHTDYISGELFLRHLFNDKIKMYGEVTQAKLNNKKYTDGIR